MWGLFLGAFVPNLKFVPLAILELLYYHLTTKNLRGHVTLVTSNESILSFQVPDVCAKFHQNWLKTATVRVHAHTHKVKTLSPPFTTLSDIGHGK